MEKQYCRTKFTAVTTFHHLSNIKFDTETQEYLLVENSILSVEKVGNAWGKLDEQWGKDLAFLKPGENILNYPHFFHKLKRLDHHIHQ